MTKSIDKKIEQLGKFVTEWPAPHHTAKLIKEIKEEIEESDIPEKGNYKILLDSMEKLLIRAITPMETEKKKDKQQLHYINKEKD